MTTKLFVAIMNALLMKLIPGEKVTLSNYCELIPILMRKLKYPGNVNRSWLITANSPHSWPYVLGLISWLTDWLSSFSGGVQYFEDERIADEMIVMNSERVDKFLEYIKKSYIDWSENLQDLCPADDEQFCDDLFMDMMMPLERNIVQDQRDIEVFESRLSELNDPEESAAVEKFQALKELEERNKTRVNSYQEKVHSLQKVYEKHKNNKQSLNQDIEGLKEVLADVVCTSVHELCEITKLESEVASIRNVIKLQDGHITDISNQCYTADITNARLQGKLDKVRLKREAMIRESTSEYVDISDLDFSLKYGNKDNAEIMKQFFIHLKKKNELLEKLDCSEKEKNIKLQIDQAEEKLRECREEFKRRQYLLEPLDLKLSEKKKSSKTLEDKLSCETKDYIQQKEELGILEQTLEKEKADFANFEKELMVMDEMLEERKVKYLNILKKLGDMYLQFVKKCEEEIKN